MKKINTSLYLPADFHDKVKEEAKRRKYTVNQWITLLLAREIGADKTDEKPSDNKRDWRIEHREHKSHLQVLRNYHIEEWESFDKFIEDMGHCPSTDYHLAILDNRRPCSPDNCMWATASEKQYIKRNINTIVNGELFSIYLMRKAIQEKRVYKALEKVS